ncbi:1663_t:CDS:1, partial [Funneliformis mosseae]
KKETHILRNVDERLNRQNDKTLFQDTDNRQQDETQIQDPDECYLFESN